MRYLPIFIFLIPIGLLIAYFGIGASLMLFSVFLSPIPIFLSLYGMVMNKLIKSNHNFWLFYGGIVGLLAAAFTIIVPFSYLIGYISVMEAIALLLVGLTVWLFFMSIPSYYYQHLKNKANSA